jgi:polyisoprenoid-binding protein YceI
MKRLALAAVVASFALPAAAQETYTVDARHTFPTFEVSHFGMSKQRGMFTKVTGKVTIDRAGKKGSADIAIDMASLATGDPKLADHLRNEDFFDVAKNPTATFKSSNFKFEGDKLVAVSGDLTLRGVTKPVTLTVDAFNCGNHPMNKKPMCGADATTVIKRTDFGIKYAVPAVSDDVKLSIPIEAFKD